MSKGRTAVLPLLLTERRCLLHYKTILFDLDGTLTDPKEGITKSVEYALNSFGIHVPDREALCRFIGPPLTAGFMEFYGFDRPTALQAVAKYRERFRDIGIFENQLYPGIPALLGALQSDGCRLVLATSKPIVFAQRILDHFELARYFTFAAGSELDGTRDKKGEVIRYALEQTGTASTAAVLMVGDREHDVIGAKENGIDCLGVLYGFGDRAELEKAGAAAFAQTVPDVKAFFLQKA